MTERICIAIVALWDTGKFGTWQIAEIFAVPESTVARVLHIGREAQRGVIVA